MQESFLNLYKASLSIVLCRFMCFPFVWFILYSDLLHPSFISYSGFPYMPSTDSLHIAYIISREYVENQ